MRPKTFVWVIGGLILAGCNHDRDALDRFSHAYTSFLDAAGKANGASFVPFLGVEDNPGNQFWTHLQSALNPNANVPNSARVQAAAAAIADYRSSVAHWMDMFSRENDDLDKTVLELIETANAVRDREYRTSALEVANSAREMQLNLAAINESSSIRFALQRKVLEGLIANGGNIVAVLTESEGPQEMKSLLKDIEERRARVATAEQKARDSFSALKGKTGMRAYAKP